MSKESRIPELAQILRHLSFGINSSFVIRHSDLVIFRKDPLAGGQVTRRGVEPRAQGPERRQLE